MVNSSDESDSDDLDYDAELEEQIYFSVESGDVVLVKSLLDQGCSPNYKFEGTNQLDKSVLHLSCEKGNEDCAKLLLDKGARINAEDGWFQTPLMYAVCTQRDNMVHLLLQQGPKLDRQDRFGRTALHYAVRGESLKILKMLVKAGAGLDIKDAVGKTPLYEAVVTEEKYSVVEYLLKKGCSVNQIDYREKRSPLGACILQTKKDRAGYVKLLLEAGADPNALDRYAHTPLVSLIKRNFLLGKVVSDDELCIAKVLLYHGAKVNLHFEVKYWYQFHGTALQIASKRGCPEIVELLLKHDANPDICDMKNVCPIHCAALKGHLEVAKLLVKYNAKLNEFAEMKISNHEEKVLTPILCAVLCNHLTLVQLLCQAGSSICFQQLRDSDDKATQLMKNEDFIGWLIETCSTPKTLFSESRLYLRKNIGQPFWYNVSLLPLPNALKLSLGLPEITS